MVFLSLSTHVLIWGSAILILGVSGCPGGNFFPVLYEFFLEQDRDWQSCVLLITCITKCFGQ